MLKIVTLCVLLMLTSCSEKQEESSADTETPFATEEERQATKNINQALLASTRALSADKNQLINSQNEEELTKLSEEDRQALIDLTIEESAKIIQEDAEKVLKSVGN